jgi:uncharacterized protein (TIGR03435 family)
VFERYTEAARRVLFFARYEADRLGSVFVESEHLLLALIREAGGMVARLFARASIAPETIRKDIDGLRPRQQASPSHETRFSDEVNRILWLATEEANRLLHHGIDTEHLLLGILREDHSVAASILATHGMRIDEVRDEIVLIHSQQAAAPPPHHTLPPEMRRYRPKRPDLPHAFGVHIAPTKKKPGDGSENGGDDFWALEGFQLKAALSRVFGSHEALFPETRIELPSSMDPRERHDFYLVLAPHDRRQDRNRLMRQGIERYFRVTITHESRSMDVYVLTAPDGQTAAIRDAPQSGGGGVGFSGFSFEFALPDGEPPTPESFQSLYPTPESMRNAIVSGGSIGGVSISNGTMEEFCKTLEQGLDRPVVDETGLGGRYDIELSGGHTRTSEFLQRLRTQLGLQLTPARRDVTMLVVRHTPDSI